MKDLKHSAQRGDMEGAVAGGFPSLRKEVLDSADVQQLLKISDRTLGRWRKEGKIPFTRVGRKYYYSLSKLSKLLL